MAVASPAGAFACAPAPPRLSAVARMHAGPAVGTLMTDRLFATIADGEDQISFKSVASALFMCGAAAALAFRHRRADGRHAAGGERAP